MEKKAIISKELEQFYQEQGLVRIQSHPTLDLFIVNYTEKVVYENLWDENLLNYRGLVYNSKYEVIGKSFEKFFNMEEEKHEATDQFEVFEKLDGSLILVFWYAGEMIVASRGSFTSPYALEAKRLLNDVYPAFQAFAYANTTYCFELIGFEQIVVSYPEPDLIMTGLFYKSNYGGYIDGDIHFICKRLPDEKYPRLVKKYSGLDWQNIKQLNWKNSEGFVVKFSNGQRCKIKFEDYIKLHRQMTNLSTTGIWEALAAGEPVSSILNDVPDEFYDKVHDFENLLIRQYEKLSSIHHIIFQGLEIKGYTKVRKDFAEKVNQLVHPELPLIASVLFCILDGKPYDKHIWKKIEPEYAKL